MTRRSATARHLGISLEEYDVRIRTFLAHYDAMLEQAACAAAALGIEAPVLLDLGIGTGALASGCLAACGGGSVIGIDSDAEMLQMARARLATEPTCGGMDLREGDYLELELPACEVAVASFSFHHIRAPAAKRRLYERCREAVRKGGGLVIADCFAPRSPALTEAGMRLWAAHLERSYSPDQARAYMTAWAKEDTYLPLRDELEWLAAAGFDPDVVWRRDLFAVLLCV